MEVKAHLRYLQVAPRKVRLVVDLVRDLPIERALDQLAHLPKRSAEPVLKLINSAIANAEHNFKLNRADLYIKSIVANEGPRLKRYRPRAFGRAAEIQKKMSHITVILEDRAKSEAPKKDTKAKPTDTIAVSKETVKGAPAEPKVVKAKVTRAKKPAAAKEHARAAQDAEVARKGES